MKRSFDDLAMAAAAGVSRRDLLRLATAAAIAVFIPVTPEQAWAAPKPRKKCTKSAQCNACQSCVGGNCVSTCTSDPACHGCVLTSFGTCVVTNTVLCPACSHCSGGECVSDCSDG